MKRLDGIPFGIPETFFNLHSECVKKKQTDKMSGARFQG